MGDFDSLLIIIRIIFILIKSPGNMNLCEVFYNSKVKNVLTVKFCPVYGKLI
jgi:hypothetical protein